MKYYIVFKLFLIFALYYDLYFFKYDWIEVENDSVCQKVPNKYLQPLLYKSFGYKKRKVEVGLLILETYSHIATILIVIETIISYAIDFSLFNEKILLAIWIISGIFVAIYFVIDYFKNK